MRRGAPDHPHGKPVPMPRGAAEDILRRHGLDAAGLAPAGLRRRWQELARGRHSGLGGEDLGGGIGAGQEIDAAGPLSDPSAVAVGWGRDATSPRVDGLPVWAWAGHVAGRAPPDEAILRDDYSDRNFLKKRLWELSGRSAEEWTLWAFDGRDLLPPVVAYGRRAILREMGDAMLRHARRGFRVPRAVFAQAPGKRFEALLLRADGRACEPPVPLSFSGPCGPAHDRDFLNRLPGVLDAMAAGRRR